MLLAPLKGPGCTALPETGCCRSDTAWSMMELSASSSALSKPGEMAVAGSGAAPGAASSWLVLAGSWVAEALAVCCLRCLRAFLACIHTNH